MKNICACLLSLLLLCTVRPFTHSTPPHPTDLDACIAEDLQSGPDISLELILHPSQTQQLHLHLKTLNHCGHLQRAVMDAELGLHVPCLESRSGRIRKFKYCEITARSETARNKRRKQECGCQPGESRKTNKE